jgi:hypothetical protein
MLRGIVHSPHRRQPLASFLLVALIAAGSTIGLAATVTSTTLTISVAGNSVTSISSPIAVTLTATVSASGTPVKPGQVLFCDQSVNTRCSGRAFLGMAQLVSGGTGTVASRFGFGSHMLQAKFIGTTTYSASQSAQVSFQQRWPPGASFTHISSTPGIVTGTYNLTVQLNGLANLGSPPIPSGTVTFVDATNSNAVVASGTLAPNAPEVIPNFASVLQPQVGQNPLNAVTADFNGDGLPDVAVMNFKDETVQIMLGQGNGYFTSGSTLHFATGASGPNGEPNNDHPVNIVAGDFNMDGKIDLAVGGGLYPGNGFAIFFGNGDGTFTTTETGISAGYMQIGDLNNDGIPDIVFTGALQDMEVLLGNGDGTFRQGQAVPPYPLPCCGFPYLYLDLTETLGDVNNDGILDMVVTEAIYAGYNGSPNTGALVQLYFGNGDGTFTPSQTLVTYDHAAWTDKKVDASPFSFPAVIADLNGDGKQDIVYPTPSDNSVTVLLGNGDGTFQTAQTYLAGDTLFPEGIAVGDFNFDGKPDLVVTNQDYHGTDAILMGNGDGSFQTPSIVDVGGNPVYTAVSNLNGDGRPDIFTVDWAGAVGLERPVVMMNQWGAESTVSVSNVSIPGSGTHQIEAYFAGDSNYRQSTSAPIALTATP